MNGQACRDLTLSAVEKPSDTFHNCGQPKKERAYELITGTHSILITGCSHSGKSTLAAALHDRLGFETFHTDELARHPGRPWPDPKVPVAEFFNSLSTETVFWLLQAHYENFQFQINHLVSQKIEQGTPFIFEGSALRPALLEATTNAPLRKFCLVANETTLCDRIHASANWSSLDTRIQTAVTAFIARTLKDNAELLSTARDNGFEPIQTDGEGWLEELVAQFFSPNSGTAVK